MKLLYVNHQSTWSDLQKVPKFLEEHEYELIQHEADSNLMVSLLERVCRQIAKKNNESFVLEFHFFLLSKGEDQGGNSTDNSFLCSLWIPPRGFTSIFCSGGKTNMSEMIPESEPYAEAWIEFLFSSQSPLFCEKTNTLKKIPSFHGRSELLDLISMKFSKIYSKSFPERPALKQRVAMMQDLYVLYPKDLKKQEPKVKSNDGFVLLDVQSVQTLLQNLPSHKQYSLPSIVPLLNQWFAEFEQEVNLSEYATKEEVIEFVKIHVQRKVDSNEVYLLMNNKTNEFVCFVAIAGSTKNSYRIGPVYTPKEYRNCGFASKATSSLCHKVLIEGTDKKFLMLFCDSANPQTNHIYQNIGFKKHSQFKIIHFI